MGRGNLINFSEEAMVEIARNSLICKRNLVLAELQSEIEHAASQPSDFYRHQLKAALVFRRDLLRNPGRALAVFASCGNDLQRTINHYLWMGGPNRESYIRARRDAGIVIRTRPVSASVRRAPRARAHRAQQTRPQTTTAGGSASADPDPDLGDPDPLVQRQQAGGAA